MYKINGKEFGCSVTATADVFNDQWKIAIIWHLLSGEKRFKELNVAIKEITQKTLTVKLRDLEEKKIINREVFAEVPLRVVYSLTPTGERLRPLFKEMYEWGIGYVEEHGEITDNDPCCEAEVAKKIGLEIGLCKN